MREFLGQLIDYLEDLRLQDLDDAELHELQKVLKDLEKQVAEAKTQRNSARTAALEQFTAKYVIQNKWFRTKAKNFDNCLEQWSDMKALNELRKTKDVLKAKMENAKKAYSQAAYDF